MPDSKREEEEKPKFRVVDRRGEEDAEPAKRTEQKPPPKEKAAKKTASQPEAAKEDAHDADSEPELTEDEKQQLKHEAESSLKFKNTVVFILRTLSEQTWIHLGLIPNPISGLTVKNLPEARKAIDLFEVIAKHTDGEFEEPLKREIAGLLTNLKLNYANQLGI